MFTVVIGLDMHSVKRFRVTWPLWKAFAPVLLQHPMVVVMDAPLVGRSLEWFDHPNCRICSWDKRWPDATQREHMLSGFVMAAPRWVETPYWLKIDVDAYPIRGEFQVQPEWFAGGPTLISNPWSYTKPGGWINLLEKWAETVPDLAKHSPLGLHCPEGVERLYYPRIISWMCFINTVWSREVAAFCPDRLPVPSQDTFHWYCAERQRKLVRRVRFSNSGWLHRVRAPDTAKILEGLQNASASP